MLNYLVAIAADAVKNNGYGWLIAAAAFAPLLALLAKKRKQSWLLRLFLRKSNSKKPGFLKRYLLKRFAHRGGKKMSDGLAILLAILSVIGIGALIVWLLGWTWAIVILVIGLLLLARKKEADYE